MALPACTRCGKRDPQRMHGLMSLWFGPLIELEADLGYFYLCPACHDEVIVPELERIQNRILELHPAAQRQLEWEPEETGPEVEPDTEAEPDAGTDPESESEPEPEPEPESEPERDTESEPDSEAKG